MTVRNTYISLIQFIADIWLECENREENKKDKVKKVVRVWKGWFVPVCGSKLNGKNGCNKVRSDEWIEWKNNGRLIEKQKTDALGKKKEAEDRKIQYERSFSEFDYSAIHSIMI